MEQTCRYIFFLQWENKKINDLKSEHTKEFYLTCREFIFEIASKSISDCGERRVYFGCNCLVGKKIDFSLSFIQILVYISS